MPYTEAIDILKKRQEEVRVPRRVGLDLQSEHERYLTEEHFKQPLVVMDYPKDIKAFYMRLNDPGDDGAAGETRSPRWTCSPPASARSSAGPARGTARRARPAHRRDGLDKDDYWWYRDLRKYGTTDPTPASGWASSGSSSSARGWAEHPRRDPVPAEGHR
jgi:asparaginyl-tRNA synthetase